MIKTWNFIIYYKEGEKKPFFFPFKHIHANGRSLHHTESTVQIMYLGPQFWSRYKVMWEGRWPVPMLWLSDLGQVP